VTLQHQSRSQSRQTVAERRRYPCFVQVGNEALQMLKSVKHAGIRDPNTDLEMLFHCSDPVEIHESHGSQDDPFVTFRRPDIIMTSLRVAKRFTGRGDLKTWSTIAKIYAPRAPISSNNRFEWYDILSALELKFKGIIAMPEILSPPQVQPPIPHQDPYEIFDSMPSDAPTELEPEYEPTVAEPPGKRRKMPRV